VQWSDVVDLLEKVAIAVLGILSAWLKYKSGKKKPSEPARDPSQIKRDAIQACEAFINRLFMRFNNKYPDVHRVVCADVHAEYGELWGRGIHTARVWAEHWDGKLEELREKVPESIELDPGHVGVLREIADGTRDQVRTSETTGTLERIYAGAGVVEADVLRVCNGTGLVFLSIHYTESGCARSPEYWLDMKTMAERIAVQIEIMKAIVCDS